MYAGDLVYIRMWMLAPVVTYPGLPSDDCNGWIMRMSFHSNLLTEGFYPSHTTGSHHKHKRISMLSTGAC